MQLVFPRIALLEGFLVCKYILRNNTIDFQTYPLVTQFLQGNYRREGLMCYTPEGSDGFFEAHMKGIHFTNVGVQNKPFASYI